MVQTGGRQVDKHIIFVGLNGYEYPHTRVRCYHFAETLGRYNGIQTHVLSFRDHLSNLSEVDMFGARDRRKLIMILRALPRIFPRFNTYFYIQKAHYNAALPCLLGRMGFNRYFFDYDDFDVDLNVTFNKHRLRTFFFGSVEHDTITRRLAANALGCVAASRSLQEYLSRFNPRVEYVPTGVRPDAFTWTDRAGRTGPVRFLWTGLVWGDDILENIIRLLEGYRAVIQAGISAQLEIIGAGQKWERMTEMIARDFSDVSDGIILTGWVDPDAMPEKLARADIGLLPFAGDTMWLRSKSPTKLFEYMASGLPVIADAVGEVRHVIEDGVSGILAGGPASFDNAMIHLCRDSERRLAMGRAARERVEHHYSIPVLMDRLARFMETVFRLKA